MALAGVLYRRSRSLPVDALYETVSSCLLSEPDVVDASDQSLVLVEVVEHLLNAFVAVHSEGVAEYGGCVPHLLWHSGTRKNASIAHNCVVACVDTMATACKHEV